MDADRTVLDGLLAGPWDADQDGLRARASTLGALFDSGAPLQTPFFQRDYRWAQDPNWRAFLADWRRAADGQDRGPLRIFLGAVVLGAPEPEANTDAGAPPPSAGWRILDGQQRLLTGMMAVKALALHAGRLGLEAEENALNGLLVGPMGQPTLTPSRADAADLETALTLVSPPPSFFEAAPPLPETRSDATWEPMDLAGLEVDGAEPDTLEDEAEDGLPDAEDGSAPDLTEAPFEGAEIDGEDAGALDPTTLFFSPDARETARARPGERLPGALRYFFRALAADLSTAANPAARWRALTGALLGRSRLIVIELAPGDDGLDVFERLNARGEPLSRLDLLKIALFDRARPPRDGRPERRPHAEAAALYESGWAATFDSGPAAAFWMAESKRFGDWRPNQDWFLRSFFSQLERGDIAHRHVTPAIRAYLAPGPGLAIGAGTTAAASTEAAAKITALGRAGAVYRDWERPPPAASAEAGGETARIQRLRLFSRFAMDPLLLAIETGADRLGDQRDTILAMLESCAIRRFLAGLAKAGDLDAYARLVRALDAAGGDDPAAAFRDTLAGMGRKDRFWPDDAAVGRKTAVRALADRKKSGPARERRALFRLLFERMDAEARGDGPAPAELTDAGLTIEHLYPVSGRAHWPPLSKREGGVLFTLGNLTMVDEALNRAMGELPWPDKRALLAERSQLTLNRQLLAEPAWAESWGPAEIRERGRRLSQLIFQRWPGPDAAAWRAARPEPAVTPA